MTARQVYEGVLIELNKVQAPSLLLEDFNYLFNKAIYQYINKKYNIYDVNQQSTDDVRVLKSTAILKPIHPLSQYDTVEQGGQQVKLYHSNAYGEKTTNVTSLNSLYGATYEFELPADYLHLLNCVCNFKVKKQFKCYDAGTYVQFGATRLTADAWSQIINNFYMRPQYKRPYYYIHNVNKFDYLPTDGWVGDEEYLSWENQTKNAINGSIKPREGESIVSELPDTNTIPYSAESKIMDPSSSTPCETDLGIKLQGSDMGTDVRNLTVQDSCDPSVSVNKYAGGGVTDNENAYELYKDGRIIKDGSNRVDAETFNLGQLKTDGHREHLGFDTNPVEKMGKVRYGNASKVRLEVRYGKDNSLFELTNIWVDYIKSPQHIRLTQEQLDLTEDTSQKMEFPDYVCQEIINELVHIVMENSSDPRMQTHPAFSQSIAAPAQAQAPAK